MDEVRAVAKATLEEIKADDVPSLAAGVAFKIFLAIFPGLIAAVAIFSLVTTPEDLPRLLDSIEGLELMPPDALELIEEPLADMVGREGGGTRGLAVGAILAGLWAATSAAATLVKALNRAYEADEKRNFLAQRGVALALTLALLLTLAGLFVLFIVGRQVQELLLPDALLGTPVDTALAIARYVGAVLVLMVVFAFTYWLGPNRERPEWQWISPGAAVGVLGWLVAALGFTLYVRFFGNYDATYGALGGVIVLMLWLQVSMMMLLIGAEVNSEREKAREPTGARMAGTAPPPPPPAPAPRPGPARSHAPSQPAEPAPPDGDGTSRTGFGLLTGSMAAAAAAAAVTVRARRKRRQLED